MKNHPKQSGFTILELMIATVVLSTILLLVTSMMVGIGRLFTKGFSQSRTQNNARSITDDLAQRLQFNNSDVFAGSGMDANTRYYCVGEFRYTYVTGVKIGDIVGTNPAQTHVLWRDKPTSCTRPGVGFMTSPNPGTGGIELIAPNSRLTSFCINCGVAGPLASPYTIEVSTAFGDTDLISSPSSYNARCIGGSGNEFCGTAALRTVVAQRYTKS
jgi:prepilin-type N-terminal cleavage/methylation domain-containing protein